MKPRKNPEIDKSRDQEMGKLKNQKKRSSKKPINWKNSKIEYSKISKIDQSKNWGTELSKNWKVRGIERSKNWKIEDAKDKIRKVEKSNHLVIEKPQILMSRFFNFLTFTLFSVSVFDFLRDRKTENSGISKN